MKQKTINTGVCDLIFVELPEGSSDVKDSHANGLIYKESDGYVETWYVPEEIEQLDWKLVSRADLVTEDFVRSLVQFFTTDEDFGSEDVFRDYTEKSFFDTALESWNSLLRANEVYWKNPQGSQPRPIDYAPYCHIEGGNSYSKMTDDDWKDLNIAQQEWKAHQKNVWDIKRTYIFKQV